MLELGFDFTDDNFVYLGGVVFLTDFILTTTGRVLDLCIYVLRMLNLLWLLSKLFMEDGLLER